MDAVKEAITEAGNHVVLFETCQTELPRYHKPVTVEFPDAIDTPEGGMSALKVAIEKVQGSYDPGTLTSVRLGGRANAEGITGVGGKRARTVMDMHSVACDPLTAVAADILRARGYEIATRQWAGPPSEGPTARFTCEALKFWREANRKREELVQRRLAGIEPTDARYATLREQAIAVTAVIEEMAMEFVPAIVQAAKDWTAKHSDISLPDDVQTLLG